GPSLTYPVGIAVDTASNLYVVDVLTASVYQLSAYGATRVAGPGQVSTNGYSGDGGPATAALFNIDVGGIAFDSAGNLYIADTGTGRVRKVSGGKIATVAGNGQYRYSGDGIAATSATLYYPNSVALDGAGNAYIAEAFRNRVRKIAANGVITTL